jgi:hypothetical protein
MTLTLEPFEIIDDRPIWERRQWHRFETDPAFHAQVELLVCVAEDAVDRADHELIPHYLTPREIRIRYLREAIVKATCPEALGIIGDPGEVVP